MVRLKNEKFFSEIGSTDCQEHTYEGKRNRIGIDTCWYANVLGIYIYSTPRIVTLSCHTRGGAGVRGAFSDCVYYMYMCVCIYRESQLTSTQNLLPDR
jgi:hypothetical protein